MEKISKGDTRMLKARLIFIGVAIFGLLVTPASADPPPGVGSADVVTDPDAMWFVAWVDVSGQSTPMLPGGEGFVLVALDDVHLVYTNNPSGNVNLKAHGQLPLGESVIAFDPWASPPGFIVATLADMDAACAALEPVFPAACRGNNAMVILNYDTTSELCYLAGHATDHWQTTTTGSGITNSVCHVLP
jgi:hypothetical protein